MAATKIISKNDLGINNVDNTSDLNKPISAAQASALAGKADLAHTHSKGQVGLANVDNTADIDKPVSTAMVAALQGKANAIHTHSKADVGLVNVDNTSDASKPISAPTATALAGKANAVHIHNRTDIAGIENIDNTSDLNKPVSIAMSTALSGKANTTHTHAKADVGLGNVDNTADANKPLSSAASAALADKEDRGLYTGINSQVGASYVLTLADKGRVVEMNNASANTVVIPANGVVPFLPNTWIRISQYGAGPTTVVPAAGVTIRSRGGVTQLTSQFSEARLVMRTTDEWLLTGDIGGSGIVVTPTPTGSPIPFGFLLTLTKAA